MISCQLALLASPGDPRSAGPEPKSPAGRHQPFAFGRFGYPVDGVKIADIPWASTSG
jgi:hypothetical protein